MKKNIFLIFLCFIACQTFMKLDSDQTQFGQIISFGVNQESTGLYRYTTLNGFFLPGYDPKKLPQQVKKAKSALLKAPRQPEAMEILVLDRLKNNNAEGALGLLLGMKVLNEKLTLLKAVSYVILDKRKEAEKIFQLSSPTPLMILNYGILKLQAGHIEEAIQSFTQVSGQEAYGEVSFLLKGEAQYSIRQLQESEKSFLKVLEINSNNSLALLNLAQLYRYGFQNRDRAIAYYKKVLNGNYPQTVTNKAERELNHYLKSS